MTSLRNAFKMDRMQNYFSLHGVESFPVPSHSKTVRCVDQTVTMGDAVTIMSENKIAAVPVMDQQQDASSPWPHRFIGVLNMTDVVLWMMLYLDGKSYIPRNMSVLEMLARERASLPPLTGDSAPRGLVAPFMPVHTSDSLYDALMILRQHHAPRVPVLNANDKLVNIITQSSIVGMLNEKRDMEPFHSALMQRMCDLGVRGGKPGNVVSVVLTDSVETAFRRMAQKNVSAVAVLDETDGSIVNCLSTRDVRHVLMSSMPYASLEKTVHQFLEEIDPDGCEGRPLSAMCVSLDDTLYGALVKFAILRIHRLFLLDPADKGAQRRPVGVLTLGDFIALLTPYGGGRITDPAAATTAAGSTSMLDD